MSLELKKHDKKLAIKLKTILIEEIFANNKLKESLRQIKNKEISIINFALSNAYKLESYLIL